MSRALHVVARLCKLAIDEARIELVGRLAAEAQAEQADRAAQASLLHEHQLASALEAADGAFAIWLPRGLEAREIARGAAVQAQDATQQGRAALAAARASAQAVDAMLAKAAAERLAGANRREQAVLDEAASRGRQDHGVPASIGHPEAIRSSPRK